MNLIRNASDQERAVMTTLLRAKPETANLINALDDIQVEQMNDGGMGSLVLVPNNFGNASSLVWTSTSPR